ncbi:HpcH/HpaI aldolase/citrate lyase family protein [Marinobacterium rhizophilum]|uniref:HpcH/HpaI aldolase/citrate lyase domain-containing protein n=1 Tax=Marinobacterium rhizophilum TaxID=420402 RepID=A0ABY5HKB3_9GAMM|nr:aldolase/citrate lyase family protein [Marinobacterium rhizophilum]UTW12033.1 hypothetical protein KDW95_22850 [Marinobacterium rhizophilum]
MTMQPNTALRSWFFNGGHDQGLLLNAIESGPAVLVVDLEEFTPGGQKTAACKLFPTITEACQTAGIECAIRLDALDKGGEQQLALIAAARPQAVLLPQIERPEQLQALRALMDANGLADTAIVPTIETRAGLARLDDILTAAPRVTAALLGTGDLSADMGLAAEPQRMQLLQPARSEFVAACLRHGVEAIDGPWPERTDPPERPQAYNEDCRFSRTTGYRSRCALTPGQVLSWQTHTCTEHAY